MILGRVAAMSSKDPSPTPILPTKSKGETVQVVVRCRPMSHKERTQGHTQIIDMWPQQGIVYISNPKRNHSCAGKTFAFDSVYDWNANQDDLYKRTVQPLVYSVLEGYNGTIFAYGQTGTGKTYTMLGSRGNPKEKGIIAKCFEEIFTHISHNHKHTSYVVRASYFEIYQEETRDLLSQDIRKKPLREDVVRGVYVKGLQSVVCKNIKAIEKVMRLGNMNRATAATNMNEHSSRSHAIFQITVEMQERAAKEAGVRQGVRVGKLNLVDLAGSERQCKTGAVGERLKESGKINLSLSALGNVISALVDGKCSHIPYRDSKLTQLLQDSLGGNSKSIMIANIGPASYNYDESLMTLRYASRAKHIRNHPLRNQDDIRCAISRYNQELRALKRIMVEQARADSSSSNTSRGLTSENTSSTEQITDESHGKISLHSVTRAPCQNHQNKKQIERDVACVNLLRNKTRIDEIRKRRTKRRVVWRLRGKYYQETTIKILRWLQEQMTHQFSEEGSSEGLRESPKSLSPMSGDMDVDKQPEDSLKHMPFASQRKCYPTGDGSGDGDAVTLTPMADKTEKSPSSIKETELTTQKLIDDLSYLVMRKSMLQSIGHLSEENRRRKRQVRALLQLAVEMHRMRERTQQQQQMEKMAILNEKRRLLRELALRSAVVRSYFADGDHQRIKSSCSYDDQTGEWFSPETLSLSANKLANKGSPGGDADSVFGARAINRAAIMTASVQ